MEKNLKLLRKCCDLMTQKQYNQIIDYIMRYPELKMYRHQDESLIFSAYLEGPDAVIQMIGAGVDPDIPDTCNGTILSSYAANNNHEMVEFLLANGANPNTVEINGETPFSWACARNSFEAAQVLWKYGAEINHPIKPNGGKPADWARLHGSAEFISWLKEIGAEESDQ